MFHQTKLLKHSIEITSVESHQTSILTVAVMPINMFRYLQFTKVLPFTILRELLSHYRYNNHHQMKFVSITRNQSKWECRCTQYSPSLCNKIKESII
jgi:hypothetical protein